MCGCASEKARVKGEGWSLMFVHIMSWSVKERERDGRKERGEERGEKSWREHVEAR